LNPYQKDSDVFFEPSESSELKQSTKSKTDINNSHYQETLLTIKEYNFEASDQQPVKHKRNKRTQNCQCTGLKFARINEEAIFETIIKDLKRDDIDQLNYIWEDWRRKVELINFVKRSKSILLTGACNLSNKLASY
jgi:hypothetical protein